MPRVVFIEGVFGRENRLEFGERCSVDEREDDERTENRGFCGFAWAYAIRERGGETLMANCGSLPSSADLAAAHALEGQLREMDPFPFPFPIISSAYTPDAMAVYSPRSLQDHLYASFLEGSTADVALHISGSWQAVYKLHRVVLIQAVSLFRTPHFFLRTEPVCTSTAGILSPPLHSWFLGIPFPPEGLTLRWS